MRRIRLLNPGARLTTLSECRQNLTAALVEMPGGVLLCSLIGVFVSVPKTRSDRLDAKAVEGNPGSQEQEPVANGESNGVAARTPTAGSHEQTILNIVTGGEASFLYPYMLLSICFALCVAYFMTAAFIASMAIMFGKARPDDIAAYLKLILSFDFGNSVCEVAAAVAAADDVLCVVGGSLGTPQSMDNIQLSGSIEAISFARDDAGR